MATAVTRITPPFLLRHSGNRSGRLVERNVFVYRRSWLIIVSGFFEPLFYLLSIGIGIGKLVGDVTFGGTTVSYAAFVAPALMASSAMNGAVFETTMNVFDKLKWKKTYDAILATPVTPRDVALGEVVWAVLRGSLYSAAFIVIMLAMGLVLSPWAILALPAAVLIGFGFAGVGMAATTFMRSWQDFEFVTLATLPLFLFSATFYPLSTYPRWLQLVVQVTPLYQGVALLRGLTTGVLSPSMFLNALYLAVIGIGGLGVASRRLGTLLLK
jgi:lipooligosaccharide transport system permease protein